MRTPAKRRPRTLVVSHSRLDRHAAGTSIRALELAGAMSDFADVRIAAVGDPPSDVAGIACSGYAPNAPEALGAPLRWAEVVLALPHWPPVMRLLRRSGKRIFFDLYVPEALESIAGFPGASQRLTRLAMTFATDRLIQALHCGRRFVCASEKQRDFLLGLMLAEGLIDTARYEADPSLRSLIDVVPFGVPVGRADRIGGFGPRDRFTGVGAEDELVLWNGGLWPWFDFATAIRAVGVLAERGREVRLVFMGAAPQVPAQRAATQARELASRLGLLNRNVFFNDAWVRYDERVEWLLDADCALSTHTDQLETRFAFRTRLLDCFWAQLPVVCTRGDDLAEVIERERLGAVVEPGDVQAVASGINQVLDHGRESYRAALERVARRYEWPVVAEPLRRFVQEQDPPRARGRALGIGHAARTNAYLAGRAALNTIGRADWPSV